MLPVVLVSLGLFNQQILTLNEINTDHIWKLNQIIPFLARIQLELFSCSSIDYNGSFIRILVNSSVKTKAECSQGNLETNHHIVDRLYKPGYVGPFCDHYIFWVCMKLT